MKKLYELRIIMGAVLLALILAACGGPSEEEPTEEELAIEATQQAQAGFVSATGEVVPSREATLGFNTNGTIVELLVEEGDVVQEGDIIARLDTTILEADVISQEAAVLVAEANLEAARIGSRDAEIAEQSANLRAAQARVNEALATLEDAQAAAEPTEILSAQVEVQQAYMQMLSDRAMWNYYRGIEDSDYRNDGYTTIDHILLPGGIEATRETYDLALQNLEVERAQLQEVVNGPNDEEVGAYEADLGAARAEAGSEGASLAADQAGAREEAIALSAAQLEVALANLDAAIVALEDAIVVAPFTGTIANLYVNQNEYVSSGDPIVDMGDLDTLRVETTDLNEVDVALFDIGSTARITFDAYPGLETQAEVVNIAPRSDEGTGVNYKVTLELSEIPDGVLWGMTAFVDIDRNDR